MSTSSVTAATVDPAAGVLERARVLLEDPGLETVRAWKEAHPDRLAVGYLPVYAPRPLLEAIGCLPVALFGGGADLEIIRGDSYFQSYMCHLPRSTLELALSGKLDALDGMIFPYTCDVIRNLSGMWKLLFADRYATLLDLPHNFDARVGGRFYAGELRRIARDLAGRGARPLEASALREAIGEENERRAVVAELDALRVADSQRVCASEAYLVVRAGAMLEARAHTALLREFLAAVAQREVRAYDNVRVVVTGAFCEQPPLELLRALEKAGCDIIADDFQLGLRTITSAIELEEGEDPVDALARAYLTQGVTTAWRYGAGAEKGAPLVRMVREADADGVIFAAASFCDPALLEQPMLEVALRREGIPFTSFKYAENTGQFQVIREQAGAFSDAVKLWGVSP